MTDLYKEKERYGIICCILSKLKIMSSLCLFRSSTSFFNCLQKSLILFIHIPCNRKNVANREKEQAYYRCFVVNIITKVGFD